MNQAELSLFLLLQENIYNRDKIGKKSPKNEERQREEFCKDKDIA